MSIFSRGLHYGEYGHLQGVEKSVMEVNGGFHLRTLGITNKILIMSEMKPKRILGIIRLSEILDIKIIADRKMIIKGGKHSHICQHVRIVYKNFDNNQIVMQLNKSIDSSKQSTLKKQKSKSLNILHKIPSSMEYSDLTSLSTAEDDMESRRLFIEPYSSKGSSSKDNNCDLPADISNAYSPVVSLKSNRISASELNSSSATSPMPSDRSSDSEDYYESVPNRKHKTLAVNEHRPSNIGRAKSVMGMYSLKAPNNEPEWTNQTKFSSENRSSSSQNSLTQFESTKAKRSLKAPRGISTTWNMEQRPSWIPPDGQPQEFNKGSIRLENNQNRTSTEFCENPPSRPRSVDISHVESLRNKFFGGIFSSNSSRMTTSSKLSEPSLTRLNGSNVSSDESITSNLSSVGDNSVKVADVYLYKPKSQFLNELYLWWNRNLLNAGSDICTLGIKTLTTNWELQDAEKVYQRVTDEWSPFQRSIWKISSTRGLSSVFRRMKSLYNDLRKHEHLKRLMWKNWDTILNIVGVIYSTEKLIESKGSTVEDFEELSKALGLMTLSMEVFRLLYSGINTESLAQESVNSESGTYTFNSTDGKTLLNLPLNLSQLTKMLVRLILKCVMVPPVGMHEAQKITEVMASPHQFMNGAWISHPNSKMINLLVITFNASAGLLHEILTLEYFSPKDTERLEFMSTLQNCTPDTYASFGITQVVNILLSHETESQNALLYRHLFVLRILLEQCHELKIFIRNNYMDDFKYFIHERNIRRKIPESHPLLPKTLEVCDILRDEILNRV